MCGTLNMDIEEVELRDMGEYVVVVRSKYGIKEGVMWLEVTGNDHDGDISSAGWRYRDDIIVIITLIIVSTV